MIIKIILNNTGSTKGRRSRHFWGYVSSGVASAGCYIAVIGEMFWRFSELLMVHCYKELGSIVNDQRVLFARACWSISFIALDKIFCSFCLEGLKTL